MKKAWVYLLVISVIHSILLYHQTYGINVILFMIPFLCFIIYYLKKNHLIKNKYGLLWCIPIILLSGTYSVYDNFFHTMNVIVIPFLYIVMFIDTQNSIRNLFSYLKHILNFIFKPFNYLGNFCKVIDLNTNVKAPFNPDMRKKIQSFFVILPIILIVLYLLSSADLVFEQYFSKIMDLLSIHSLQELFGRVIQSGIFFLYTGSTLIYLLKIEKINQKAIKIDHYTIRLLLTILNIIYVLFDIIQIRSLLLHQVGSTFTYAEYARRGFFQLMFISFINMSVVILSKNTDESRYNNFMSLLMIFLTFIIVCSSFIRMYLYEQAYGYTVLRLCVYLILITEIILMLPTIVYIFKKDLNLLRFYMVIPVVVYVLVNMASIDQVIAGNNINRYYQTNKIDLDYLENYRYDNIPYLLDFYEHCDDLEIKEELDWYFDNMMQRESIDMDNILEYNISKDMALQQLKKGKS